MAKSWYVLHVYSGYEAKIERTIRMLIANGDLDGAVVTDIKIPSEEVVDVKDGKRRTSSRKMLPGYILVEMDLPESDWKATCSTIKKITGVTGFVGATMHHKPAPISGEEARHILQRAGEIKGDRPAKSRQTFSVGEQVKIIEGPFDSFTGTIEEVSPDKNKLRVMVGIFGRATPVEVDMLQVEKM
ncbi:MAG TPA: transcription termination/antitermination protein NusG [Spirochaetia bacterium]|nr:transcription termination/antitermination factor NusG [Spirochaetaceae bacterium]HRW23776.1 transcription termination/antitermination protein NusG [Spirochaetia bacterium]